ncbi:MAG: GNAT family N-acetyltransferase [Solirubrobacteraceae bacterium]|nr:GNAT family N-acetyltransferase [Patulibacter sp.]
MPRVTLLEPTGPVLRSAVLSLAPSEEEAVWSGRASDTLPAAEADPTRHPVAMIDEAGVPVGFLVLDLGARSRRYARGGDEIGVHGFFVDLGHRRRGIARGAIEALPAYVAEHHPQITSIALTVVVENRPAVGAYLAGGMHDTGDLFLGGTNGPQHVMRMSVHERH